MALIPERLWEQMTADEQELVTAYIDGFRHEPRIVCPHCGGGVAVRVKVTAGATRIDSDTGERVPGVQSTPPRSAVQATVIGASDRAFLEAARTSGVLGAFFAAAKTEKEHSGTPADIEALFLLFWKTADPIRVSSVVLAHWKEEFGGFIEVYQSQGIIAVLSDGELRTFFPNRLTLPAKAKNGIAVSNAGGFGAWVKGRFGYVPVEARAFGEALKQRNVGSFGTMVQ